MNTRSAINSELPLLLAIGECHRRLSQHAIRINAFPAVRSVKHVVCMPELGEAFRLEECVDAELVTRDAISWYFETTITASTIAIEADIRRIHSQGQDLIESVGEFQLPMASESIGTMLHVVDRLCAFTHI
jgi:hypothetical protein